MKKRHFDPLFAPPVAGVLLAERRRARGAKITQAAAKFWMLAIMRACEPRWSSSAGSTCKPAACPVTCGPPAARQAASIR